MNNSTDTCRNCRYFDEFEIQKKEDNVIGACKANPPFIPYPNYNRGKDEKENKLGVWPVVIGHWWCGIFDSKEEKEENKIEENA